MTREEAAALKEGDHVTLVDNVQELIQEASEQNTVLGTIYSIGTVYEVEIGVCHETWVGIKKNDLGDNGHGWPPERWKVVDKYDTAGLYELLGMKV